MAKRGKIVRRRDRLGRVRYVDKTTGQVVRQGQWQVERDRLRHPLPAVRPTPATTKAPKGKRRRGGPTPPPSPPSPPSGRPRGTQGTIEPAKKPPPRDPGERLFPVDVDDQGAPLDWDAFACEGEEEYGPDGFQ